MTCTAGADTDGFNRFDDGRNALHFVAGFENAPLVLVAKCVELGCDVNAFSTHWRWGKGPPLACVQTEAMAAELVAHGADVNAADEDMVTVLMYAAWSGVEGVVRFLLEARADPLAVDGEGTTAIDWAYGGFHTSENVVMLLLEAGAVPGNREKILEKARKDGYDRVAAWLEASDGESSSCTLP